MVYVNNRYIGIDLTDPYAVRRRSGSVVEFVPEGDGLRGCLKVRDDLCWPAIYPNRATDLSVDTPWPAGWPEAGFEDRLWIAIDGPQGLAAESGATIRSSECESGTPGRTPHDYPHPDMPFSGFVTGSVVLWSQLTRFLNNLVHVDTGVRPPDNAQINLCEVYPGVTWFDLTRPRRMPPKSEQEGKQARIALLEQLGVRVPSGTIQRRDADDVLDAGVGALVAYAWSRDVHRLYGEEPSRDERTQTLREGYIRSFRRGDLPGSDLSDFKAIDEEIQMYRDRRAGCVVNLNNNGVIPKNQEEVVAQVADPVYDEYLQLCLQDNGGVWEQHNDWLIDLAPEVTLLTADGLNLRLSPSNHGAGQWKCLPTCLSLARRYGFEGDYLSGANSILLPVRIAD